MRLPTTIRPFGVSIDVFRDGSLDTRKLRQQVQNIARIYPGTYANMGYQTTFNTLELPKLQRLGQNR